MYPWQLPRKTLSLLGVGFALFGILFGALIANAQTLEYSSTDQTASIGRHGNTDAISLCQPFTGVTADITFARVPLKYVTAARTGDIYLALYAYNGTTPTSLVASSTNVNASNLTSNIADYDFTFSSPAALSGGDYCIYIGTSLVNSVGTSYQIGEGDNAGPGGGFNLLRNEGGGGWTDQGTELAFELYSGDEPAASSTTSTISEADMTIATGVCVLVFILCAVYSYRLSRYLAKV